jgi:hypothetical protein
VRAIVERALARVIAWVRRMGAAVLSRLVAAFGWWKRRRRVGTGEETQTLYYSSDNEGAELMLASSPRRLGEFLAEIETKPEYAGKKKDIAKAKALATEMVTLRRQYRAAQEKRRETLGNQINARFDQVGGLLGRLFSGSAAGKRSSPLELDWPGPQLAPPAYPVLYFGGRIGRPRRQSVLKAMHTKGQKDETGTAIAAYHPTRPRQLPGGATIGVTTNLSQPIGPLRDAGTPGGGKFYAAVVPYGFDATQEGLDADHVQEIQVGGSDSLQNLWPLDASVNRSKGSSLSKRSTHLDGASIQIASLKRVRSKEVGKEKFFFRIRSYR